MSQKGENIAALTVFLLIIINAAGLGIPVWYNKEHQHNVNTTVEEPTCVMHVNIREGLWQRYCIESRIENCQLDVQGGFISFHFFSYSIHSIFFCNL